MSELYEKSLLKLELDQVLSLLSECAGSQGGKEACLTLVPSSDLEEVQQMLDETTALVGISDFAQSELGDLVFVNLPQVGDEVAKEETLCDVESVKAVSDVMSPVSGVVAEVNEELLDAPEKLNDDPYSAWIAKIENITDTEELMDADAYEAFTQEG